ncbi:hypothetical protein [Gilvimarinus xylanilyticus]|uniref:Integrase catalytic domain-containing protein n=1 Tax=Gilvimarinus xylanilyticus TaxID=2944139 RepID=A0A9X2KWZ1_9GAMM|nr:hypothetical protein [Gilvimarinus xylanilyticus]MCP8899910.1 hypothetical protein [Gilvimarinus xylanilyticus]
MIDSKSTALSREFRLQKVVSPSQDLEDFPEIGGHKFREAYLAVFLDYKANQVFLINLHSTAKFPICVPLDELCNAIDRCDLELSDLGLDTRVTLPEEQLPEGYIKKMNLRFRDIETLVRDLSTTLRSSYGDGIFEEAMKRSGRSRQYIYDTFYSYLRSGRRLQGLGLPQGKDANRVPKKRSILVKQGAPNKDIARGKILNDSDYKAFDAARRLYSKTSGMSIKRSLEIIWRKRYFKTRTSNTLIEKQRTGENYSTELLPPEERPSHGQYYYWLKKYYGGSIPKRDRKKSNATEYDANLRGRPGDAYTHLVAPGECYVLDETPFDEELVSAFDPTRSTKIGKPTLYFVRDIFTRAIVGVYITTQNPSYATVKEALFCAVREKSDFLKEIGIPMDPKEWPMAGVPQAIFVDRAEFHNRLSEGPLMDLPITVKFARAGRGDDKPLAETIFNVFSKFMQGVSSAHQTKSQRDIALQVARKKACLTISELYYIASIYIRHYNNTHLIEDYPLTREMVRDGVKPIPRQIWEWGSVYRPSGFVQISESELYLKLLEAGEVSVHKDGLLLLGSGLRYNCAWTLEQGLQDRRPHGNSAVKFPCRLFRGLVDLIFVSTAEGLKPATLDARDQRFTGLSFVEVHHQRESERSDYADLKETSLRSKVFLDDLIETTVNSARSVQIKAPVPKLGKIKEQRMFESTLELVTQQYRFLNAAREQFGIGLSDTSETPYEEVPRNEFGEIGTHESHEELDAFNQ